MTYLSGMPVFDLLSRIRPDDGRIEWLVDIYHGLRIMMFFNEHPPPHFAVRYDGQTASFAIETCARLRGNRGLERYEPKIRAWWQDNRTLLIETWNSSRPADCTVGPIRVGAGDTAKKRSKEKSQRPRN